MIALFFSLASLLTGGMLLGAFLVYLGAMGQPGDGPEGEAMRPFLVARSFYVNPDDPRGWVPKISGVGMTINFRTRRNAVVFVVLILWVLAASLGLTAACAQI